MQVESLVLYLDALLKCDDFIINKLNKHYPLMEKEEINASELKELYPDALTTGTNYFYIHKGIFGVVLEDTPNARSLVNQFNIDSNMIYWGYNSDPVQMCTAAQIIKKCSIDDGFATHFKRLSIASQLLTDDDLRIEEGGAIKIYRSLAN